MKQPFKDQVYKIELYRKKRLECIWKYLQKHFRQQKAENYSEIVQEQT
jgi:hypothetical protein